MAKHTQTIRQLLPISCLSIFDHYVRLALKGLTLRYMMCIYHITRPPQMGLRQTENTYKTRLVFFVWLRY